MPLTIAVLGLNEIGVARCRDETRQRVGIMGEIGVHLSDEIRIHRQRTLESGDVCRTKTSLLRAVNDLDAPGMCGRKRVRHVAGAIRRAIVDDQNGVARSLLEYAEHQRFDVRPLVIGWDDNHDRGSILERFDH